MKIPSICLNLLAAAVLSAPHLNAHDDHEHREAGPNGGRLVTSIEPHAEILLTSDRLLQITFVDESGQPIPPRDQQVSATAGDRSNPTKLEFESTGTSLTSTSPVPPGDNLPVIVKFTSAPNAKPTYERFNLNLAACPTCEFQEYSCTCNH